MRSVRPFDARFAPPAAVLSLPVRMTSGGPTVLADFLLDAGADRTAVPLAAAAAAGFDPVTAETRRMLDYEGSAKDVPAADFTLTLLGRPVGGLFVTVASSYGLLGRDVLTFFRVTLDGPAGTLAVED